MYPSNIAHNIVEVASLSTLDEPYWLGIGIYSEKNHVVLDLALAQQML